MDNNPTVIEVTPELYDLVMKWQEALMELDEIDLIRVKVSDWYHA